MALEGGSLLESKTASAASAQPAALFYLPGSVRSGLRHVQSAPGRAGTGAALHHRSGLHKRRREITKYIENITGNVDIATKDTMVNSPLPMIIFRPESGDIIWTNDRFLQLTGDKEHLFDAKLETVLPDFDTRWLLEGKSECPDEVKLGERRFLVYGHLVRASERGGGFLATTYWVDVTELANTRDRGRGFAAGQL